MAAVALEPDSPDARCVLAHLFVQQGSMPDALDQARQCQQKTPHPVAIAILGVCLARSGQKDQAINILNRLLEISTAEYVDPYLVLQIHLALGDLGKALEFTQKMLDERSPFAVYLDFDPVFDPLRSDPRFDQLVSQLKH